MEYIAKTNPTLRMKLSHIFRTSENIDPQKNPNDNSNQCWASQSYIFCVPPLPYSAAICLGAGGGLARSAESCSWRVFASFTAFSFTGP